MSKTKTPKRSFTDMVSRERVGKAASSAQAAARRWTDRVAPRGGFNAPSRMLGL